ncbi:hypothetical protein BTN50_1710 (plasmid) [Candidatus Enterovibrio altilux]|uniref:Mobile element protein n=1 Tax=Candidatus Enterovibrio altilux TaxID=1927128 RepID=A0A291BAW6_9GAMM|nr:hypothetical protein BTN50_1710 [Candidatus Enterovibrio luxaltus]
MKNFRSKTTNWKQYNEIFINLGSLTFWIDNEAIQLLHKLNRIITENFVYSAV